jgi:hypothetical protein
MASQTGGTTSQFATSVTKHQKCPYILFYAATLLKGKWIKVLNWMWSMYCGISFNAEYPKTGEVLMGYHELCGFYGKKERKKEVEEFFRIYQCNRSSFQSQREVFKRVISK